MPIESLIPCPHGLGVVLLAKVLVIHNQLHRISRSSQPLRGFRSPEHLATERQMRLRPPGTVLPVGAIRASSDLSTYQESDVDCVFLRQFLLGLFPAWISTRPPATSSNADPSCPSRDPIICARLPENSAIRRCEDRSASPTAAKYRNVSPDVTATSRHPRAEARKALLFPHRPPENKVAPCGAKTGSAGANPRDS